MPLWQGMGGTPCVWQGMGGTPCGESAFSKHRSPPGGRSPVPWELWSLEELMKVGVERSRVPTLLPRDSRGMDQTPRSVQGSRAGAASWPKPPLETRLRQQGGGQPECEQAGSGTAENPPPAPADAGWVPATPSGLRILRRTLKHSVSTDGNTASNGQERG